jgi:protein O-GlcNAc transferase
MGKRTSSLSPAQHQQVRQKLGAIMQSIQKGQLQPANSALGPLLRKYSSLPEVNHVAAGLNAAMRQYDRAHYYATCAVELDPHAAEYRAGLGSLLLAMDRNEEAVALLESALSLSPELTDVLVPLATAQMQVGRIGDARHTFHRVLESNATNLEAANNLALLESDLGNADRAIQIIEQALSHHQDDPKLLDALSMFSCYSDTCTPEESASYHRRFGESVQRRVRVTGKYPHTPDPDRRIRIGFVSPDFRRHSIAYFVHPIIKHLDRDRFEVCVYHTSRHHDAMSDQIKLDCDRWIPCQGGMVEAHQRILADQVDLLVELNGHFAGNLLPMFASKPTPTSVTMIGYANTTGLGSIDARIVDHMTDPKPDADALATERLIRVAGCFLSYRPSTDAPDCADPEPDRDFTFGSFNDLRKMSPSTIVAWSNILEQCPGSRLMLKTARLDTQEVCDDVHRRFEVHGIDATRVVLCGRTESMAEHLRLYNQLDCALDTFPYTGTTTTCEALHMGVPTVTLLGKTHAGRVSASLLQTVGLAEWVAHTESEYIGLATSAFEQGKRLGNGRSAMRNQLESSELCDEPAYTKRIGEAFETIWSTWCASKGRG